MSCFADDILLEINDGEDIQLIQNDLHKLYISAETYIIIIIIIIILLK